MTTLREAAERLVVWLLKDGAASGDGCPTCSATPEGDGHDDECVLDEVRDCLDRPLAAESEAVRREAFEEAAELCAAHAREWATKAARQDAAEDYAGAWAYRVAAKTLRELEAVLRARLEDADAMRKAND